MFDGSQRSCLAICRGRCWWRWLLRLLGVLCILSGRSSHRVENDAIDAGIGELCRSIVVIDEIVATRCGFALLPAGWKGAELIGQQMVDVDVAGNARIVPGRDARWNVEKVDLSLLGCSHFISRRQIDCRPCDICTQPTSARNHLLKLTRLSLPLTSLRLFLTPRRPTRSLCFSRTSTLTIIGCRSVWR